MNKWLPIESAPMDGRPVWVRGNNWGRSDGGFHHGWAYFDEGMWRWPEASGEESGNATYLTHWFPFTAPTGATP